MKSFIFLCAAILVAALNTGCAGLTVSKALDYTVNTATIVTSIRYIDKNIDDTVNKIYDVDFYTTDEQVALDRLFSDIDFIISRVEALVNAKDLQEAYIPAADVEMLLLSARNVYTEMYVIVSAHFTEYDPETQIILSNLNENLLALDKAWSEVSKTPDGRDITPIIKGALKVIDGGIKVSKMAVRNK